MVYLSGCAPSHVWINYDPFKVDKRFQHSAAPILSEGRKESHEGLQEKVLHSNVKNSPAILGSKFLFTEEATNLSHPTPLPVRTVAPTTATVKISHPTPLPNKTFMNSTPKAVASRTPQVATEKSNRVNSTRLFVFQRPLSTQLPASRTASSVVPLPINTKQVLQKPLPTVAKTENSNFWFWFKTTALPTSPARTKTNPTTELPVPQRTRATPKPSTKTTPSSGLGKGNQGTGSPNKSDNSSLIAPSSIIVVPPLTALCPEGQKHDDLGICREEFR